MIMMKTFVSRKQAKKVQVFTLRIQTEVITLLPAMLKPPRITMPSTVLWKTNLSSLSKHRWITNCLPTQHSFVSVYLLRFKMKMYAICLLNAILVKEKPTRHMKSSKTAKVQKTGINLLWHASNSTDTVKLKLLSLEKEWPSKVWRIIRMFLTVQVDSIFSGLFLKSN